MISIIETFFVRISISLIRAYQATLSLDHGLFKNRFPFGYCKYSPTCSNYAIQALRKKGFVKGVILALYRVLRCNPWSRGGYDPLE